MANITYQPKDSLEKLKTLNTGEKVQCMAVVRERALDYEASLLKDAEDSIFVCTVPGEGEGV